MKKVFISIFLMYSIIIPTVNASEEKAIIDNSTIIATNTKYYKTITNNNPVFSFNNDNNTVTFEISKDEYDNYEESNTKDGYVETNYKKLTSTISSSGNYYKYSATLTWKNMPSVRKYDIIGIGFYSSVKVRNNNIHFSQSYCLSSGSCYTSYTNYPQIFSGGAGTTFLLPSGSLTSLSSNLYFEVEKNTTATITSQLAAADYSHATKSISLTNAKKYTVSGNSGIILNGVSSYYDAINPAIDYWYGNW